MLTQRFVSKLLDLSKSSRVAFVILFSLFLQISDIAAIENNKSLDDSLTIQICNNKLECKGWSPGPPFGGGD